MKIKSGYLLRDVAGAHVVVPVGNVDFDGMIKLNETGVCLWKQLENDTTAEALINAILSEYNVERFVAEADVNAFINKLRSVGLLDE